jgi:hypothetical protein
MEHRTVSNDYSQAEADSLTLPHFDEEVTVQSARPVVPLYQVQRGTHSPHRLILVAALCLAALIGAVTASVIYQRSTQSQEPATAATSPAESAATFIAPSGEASGASVNPDEAVALDKAPEPVIPDDDQIEVERVGSKASQPKLQNRTSPKHPQVAVRQSQVPDQSEHNFFLEEEAWRERRREARQLRRERRLEERRRADGSTRIREIFEGSPRP